MTYCIPSDYDKHFFLVRKHDRDLSKPHAHVNYSKYNSVYSKLDVFPAGSTREAGCCVPGAVRSRVWSLRGWAVGQLPHSWTGL